MTTFEEGKELLSRLKEISFYSDSLGKHATVSACYSIEQLLEILNERRRNLEELWIKRKQKLEQCIQICYLREEIKRVISIYFQTYKLDFNYFIFRLTIGYLQKALNI